MTDRPKTPTATERARLVAVAADHLIAAMVDATGAEARALTRMLNRRIGTGAYGPPAGPEPDNYADALAAEAAGNDELARLDALPWSDDDPGRLDATDGVLVDIGNERARQYGELGHSLDDDDTRTQGQLAQLASNWARPWPSRTEAEPSNRHRRRSELVKAAALLVAEIERLDRIEAGQ